MFAKAGVDLTADAAATSRRAWPPSPRRTPAPARPPARAVDGFPTNEPFWGAGGSPNAQDWFELNLGQARTVNEVRLYLKDRATTDYRPPSAYQIQYYNGSAWTQRGRPGQEPGREANYNLVTSPRSTPRGCACWPPTPPGSRPASPRSRSTTAAEWSPPPVTNLALTATPTACYTSPWESVRRDQRRRRPAASNDTVNARLGHLAQHRQAVGPAAPGRRRSPCPAPTSTSSTTTAASACPRRGSCSTGTAPPTSTWPARPATRLAESVQPRHLFAGEHHPAAGAAGKRRRVGRAARGQGVLRKERPLKRWLCSTVAALLVVGVAGCGGKDDAPVPVRPARTAASLSPFGRGPPPSPSPSRTPRRTTHRTRTRSRSPRTRTRSTRRRSPRRPAPRRCRTCSPPTWCSRRSTPPRACGRTSPTSSTRCRSRTRSHPRTCATAPGTSKIYAVPHTIDMSVMLYNKDLFKKAGLDPEKPPTTLQGVRRRRPRGQQAGRRRPRHLLRRQLRRLQRLHLWPSVWAAGGDVMNEDGTESTINNQEMADVFAALPQALRRGRGRPGVQGRGRPDLARRAAERQDRHRARPVGVARPHRGEVELQARRRADQRPRRRRVDVRRRRRHRHRRHQQARRRRPGTSCPGPSATRPRSRSSPRTRACRSAPTSPRTSTPRPTPGSSRSTA